MKKLFWLLKVFRKFHRFMKMCFKTMLKLFSWRVKGNHVRIIHMAISCSIDFCVVVVVLCLPTCFMSALNASNVLSHSVVCVFVYVFPGEDFCTRASFSLERKRNVVAQYFRSLIENYIGRREKKIPEKNLCTEKYFFHRDADILHFSFIWNGWTEFCEKWIFFISLKLLIIYIHNYSSGVEVSQK